MNIRFIPRLMAVLTLLLVVAGCGGGDASMALQSTQTLNVTGSDTGSTPFIAFVRLGGDGIDGVSGYRYSIEPRAGAVAAPVTVSYSRAALESRGYLATGRTTASLPVFGLYAGASNQVRLSLQFSDGSVRDIDLELTAPAYADPDGVYSQPTVLRKATSPAGVGFSYMYLKSAQSGPVIVDIDGAVRWVGPAGLNAYSSAFEADGFVVGAQNAASFIRLRLDGQQAAAVTLDAPTFTAFHHNISPGKNGWLGEFDAIESGVRNIESIMAEFDAAGRIVGSWDFAQIVADYMRSQGDDPSAFVRPGIDWFHMNAAVYDPRDDSFVVSARESFVVKITRSGQLLWVLGDPTKYWYSFPSLRAKALQVNAGGFYPIGQHAVSITRDGLLMLFDNGLPSSNQPAGAPVGEARNYSAVSAFAIDAANRSARAVWRFDYGRSILSDICSSAYESRSGGTLINYAVADGRSALRLVGLDAAREVSFDLRFRNTASCRSSWNAEPIDLDRLEVLR